MLSEEAHNTSVGILGLGAIGSVMASLIKSEFILQAYNRSPRHQLRLLRDTTETTISIQCFTSLDDAPSSDWLLICLKEHQYLPAQNWLKYLINDSSTKVVVIRNGIRLKESVWQYCPDECIIECLIDCPTQPVANGYYRQFKQPTLTLSNSRHTLDFLSLLEATKATIQVAQDFKTDSWKKLCESSALGAILCLTGETCWIFEQEKIRILYRDLLQECVNVARADGAKIEQAFVDEMLQKLLCYPATKGSSMLTDRQQGRLIELGAKNGMISKIAKQHQVNTPLNDWATTLLNCVNANKTHKKTFP